MGGHGLALGLPQICPMKSGLVLEHSLSCASVVFKGLRNIALDCDDMRWTRNCRITGPTPTHLEKFDFRILCV